MSAYCTQNLAQQSPRMALFSGKRKPRLFLVNHINVRNGSYLGIKIL
uniref:Uncharacterized protein n=1 Tax=Anguilla anguilla TaxID=7936 RepID=A0A0E9WDX9_ANGAN